MTALQSKILLCLGGLLLGGCDEQRSEPVELTHVQSYMMDPVAMARAEALFLGTCAGLCHTLEPDPVEPAFLFDCEWRHGASDEALFDIITTGIPDTRMVGFGNNFPEGDADKWKIIAFLRANQQPCD